MSGMYLNHLSTPNHQTKKQSIQHTLYLFQLNKHL